VKKIILLFVSVLVALIFGCAPLNFYSKLDPFITSGDFKSADALVDTEKKQYEGMHELLYYFDKGSLLQMLGDYKASAKNLDLAEEKIDDLYTKSATKEVSSFLSNDLNLPYEGEDFEQVMVNIMKALDYMYAGDFDGSRVEARKVNNRLNLLSDRYEGKSKYKDDAFARYLSAYSFEAGGNLNDAYIDYKKSYKAYQDYGGLFGTAVPEELKSDLLRVSYALHFKDDYKTYVADFPGAQFIIQDKFKTKADVLIVIYDGMAPYKISTFITTPVYNKQTGKTNVIRVAFPKFLSRGYNIESASLNVSGHDYNSFISEDINTMAIKSLEDRNALISVKAIARATAKYLAGQAISQGGKNAWLDLAANIYNVASEQADTRSWRTLPSRFHLIRIQVPPGKYNLKLTLHLTGGATREENIDIVARNKKVVPVYCF
jgi:hypothetical protein